MTENTRARHLPQIDWLVYASEAGDMEGWCLACGDAFMVEPDAHAVVCPNCDQAELYGCEELLLMGLYREGGEA